MKNFSGRLIILISVLLGIFTLFSDLGITIFYIWTKFDIVIAELSSPNCLVDYIGLFLHVFSFILTIIALFYCLKNIILATRMKRSMYLSIIALLILISSFLFNLLMPGITLFDSVPYIIPLFILKVLTNIGLCFGSILNYRKDCR